MPCIYITNYIYGFVGTALFLGAKLSPLFAGAMVRKIQRLLSCALSLTLMPCSSTDAPIIGVLSVPADGGCETAMAMAGDGTGVSCFASLYSKFIEAAGGRVVPLLYDWSDGELEEAFGAVNGVLFTGGGVDIARQSNAEAKQYLHAASVLFNLTLASSDWVPLWGTCLGLQTLSVLGAGTGRVLQTYAYDSEDLSLPLRLTTAANRSRLLGHAFPRQLKRWITSENLTTNLHHDGVAPEEFEKNSQLKQIFQVLSTNQDRKGKSFVSVIEGRDRPIYGVQFHPERPLFSWASEEGINHGPHAIEVMQYFANFFLSQARMNSHQFKTKKEEDAALIYNYQPVGHSSYQCYTFRKAGTAVASEAMLV